jgi:hypothetical protein
MSCERYAKTLAARAAGAQVPPELDEHLAACQACRAELLALREALALADATLGEVAAAEPGPELAPRILRAAAVERARQTSGLAWRWGWAVASAGALIAIVWFATSVPRGTPSSAVNAARPAMSAPSRSAESREDARIRADARESRTVRVRKLPRAATTEPLVLVPAGEREALLRFAAELQKRTVAPDSLLVADPMRELPPVEPVRIEPLEIAPLAGADQS